MHSMGRTGLGYSSLCVAQACIAWPRELGCAASGPLKTCLWIFCAFCLLLVHLSAPVRPLHLSFVSQPLVVIRCNNCNRVVLSLLLCLCYTIVTVKSYRSLQSICLFARKPISVVVVVVVLLPNRRSIHHPVHSRPSSFCKILC